MIDNKFVRWNVKIHHPDEKCISSNEHNPCPYCKVEGSQYCVRHGANNGVQAKAKEAQKNYRLARWQSRVGELADNSSLKNLHEEIGILRMILEEMMLQCDDSMELLLYSSRMSDLVMKIEKLVSSCDKLENKMGLLLSKDSVLHLASIYVNIINNHVTDPDVIEQISIEMVEATNEISNPLIEAR